MVVLGMIAFGGTNINAQSINSKSDNVQTRNTKNVDIKDSINSQLKHRLFGNDKANPSSKKEKSVANPSQKNVKNTVSYSHNHQNDGLDPMINQGNLNDHTNHHNNKSNQNDDEMNKVHSKANTSADQIHSGLKSKENKKTSENSLSAKKNNFKKHHYHHHKHDKRDRDIYHKVHVDNNEQNIGGMNSFTHKRRHYLYKLIGGNTRDLGGYPVKGHKHTERDRIIRSADLDGLSKAGGKALNQLHVNKIIDLRYYQGNSGIEGHPDPSELISKVLKGTGIRYQLDPLYTHTEAHQLSKYMKKHDEHGEYYFYGNLSVSKPQAIKTYRKVFSDLLHNQHGAIMFHCNLGRDRTGVTSALILSALGVNHNLIYHDYLLTDHYHYHIDKMQPYPKQAAELQHFFNTIDRKYGSVHTYLSKKIGLNHAKMAKLRKMYLISNK